MAIFGRKSNPEARMSLGEHFREFRNRAVVCALAILLAGVGGWFLYEPLLRYLSEPLAEVSAERANALVQLSMGGITTPFTVHVKVAIWLGVIMASPVWLWEIWAFLVPGLKRNEKKVARLFIGAAVPLFLGGCALAVWAFPKVVRILLGFTPEDTANLPEVSLYLSFAMRFVLAFGIAFLLPVFLVALNVARILPGRVMLKGWRFAVIGIFVFAAMMTPTPDAWTMLALAFPMLLLYYAACFVSIWLDKRRAKRTVEDRPEWMDLSDDPSSTL